MPFGKLAMRVLTAFITLNNIRSKRLVQKSVQNNLVQKSVQNNLVQKSVQNNLVQKSVQNNLVQKSIQNGLLQSKNIPKKSRLSTYPPVFCYIFNRLKEIGHPTSRQNKFSK